MSSAIELGSTIDWPWLSRSGMAWIQIPWDCNSQPSRLALLLEDQAREFKRYAVFSEDSQAFPLDTSLELYDLRRELCATIRIAYYWVALALGFDPLHGAGVHAASNSTGGSRAGSHKSADPLIDNDLMPLEWRHAATRSFLPDQLPRHIERWRGYLAQVERGWHEAYLEQTYLYNRALRQRQRWRVVRASVWKTLASGASEPVRPELRSLAAAILSLPEPAIPPRPLWAYWQSRPKAPSAPAVEPELLRLDMLRAELAALTREFDLRATRQSRHSYHGKTFDEFMGDEESFEDFVAGRRRDALVGMIDWLESSAAAGFICVMDA